MNRFLLFFLFSVISCNNFKTNKNKQYFKKGTDINYFYNLIDSISESRDKFSEKNIKIMANLYNNDKIKEVIKNNAYSGLDKYFLNLFESNSNKFYHFLELHKGTATFNRIKSLIQEDLVVREDFTDDFNYRDSLYNNHLEKSNLKYHNLIKDIIGK